MDLYVFYACAFIMYIIIQFLFPSVFQSACPSTSASPDTPTPCVSQGSLEKQNKHYRYTGRDLLWATGSCDNEGWEVPRPAFCKLEAQESRGCNSTLCPETWEPEGPMAWIPGQGQEYTDIPGLRDICQASRKQEANPFFLGLLFHSGP